MNSKFKIIFILLSVIFISGCFSDTKTQGGIEVYNMEGFSDGHKIWKEVCNRKHGLEILEKINECISSLTVEENAWILNDCRVIVVTAMCPKEVAYYED